MWIRWTKKEDALLRKHFSINDWDGLLRIFRGRSRVAISLRATRDLRLHRKNPEKMAYSEREKAIIRRQYGHATKEELMKMLPNRNWIAIRAFAKNTLNVSRKTQPFWSPAELKILREHYADSPWEALMNLLPGKTRPSISIKGMRLGIKRNTKWFWSEDQIKFLTQIVKASAKIKSRRELRSLLEGLSEKTGRTIAAVQEKIRHLNLKWRCPISLISAEFDTRADEDKKWLANLKAR